MKIKDRVQVQISRKILMEQINEKKYLHEKLWLFGCILGYPKEELKDDDKQFIGKQIMTLSSRVRDTLEKK